MQLNNQEEILVEEEKMGLLIQQEEDVLRSGQKLASLIKEKRGEFE